MSVSHRDFFALLTHLARIGRVLDVQEEKYDGCK